MINKEIQRKVAEIAFARMGGAVGAYYDALEEEVIEFIKKQPAKERWLYMPIITYEAPETKQKKMKFHATDGITYKRPMIDWNKKVRKQLMNKEEMQNKFLGGLTEAEVRERGAKEREKLDTIESEEDEDSIPKINVQSLHQKQTNHDDRFFSLNL